MTYDGNSAKGEIECSRCRVEVAWSPDAVRTPTFEDAVFVMPTACGTHTRLTCDARVATIPAAVLLCAARARLESRSMNLEIVILAISDSCWAGTPGQVCLLLSSPRACCAGIAMAPEVTSKRGVSDETTSHASTVPSVCNARMSLNATQSLSWWWWSC